MLEATAEANNLAAVALAKDHYGSRMEEICGGNTPFMNPNTLEQRHNEVFVESLTTFHKSRKMGGKEFSEAYLERLQNEISESWEHFQAQNKSKNMFSLLGGPVVLLCWCVVCYIMSRIFEIVSITPIANLFFFFGTVSLALTIAYMFFRYGGTMPEFVIAMDSCAEFIWGFALDFSFKVMQNQVQNRTGLNFNNSTMNATGYNSTASTPAAGSFAARSPPFPARTSPQQKKS
jgi:atlastin